MRQKNPERVSVRGFYLLVFFFAPSIFGGSDGAAGPPYFNVRVMTTCGMPASTNSSPSMRNPCAS